MTALESILSIALAAIYIVAIFTVAVMTFIKGRYVLGVLGIFLPFLWLIGAVLPARKNSYYARRQQEVRDLSGTNEPAPGTPTR